MKGPTLESAYKAGTFDKNSFVLGTLIIVLLLSTSLRTLNENCKINNKVVSGVSVYLTTNIVIKSNLLTFLLRWFMNINMSTNHSIIHSRTFAICYVCKTKSTNQRG